MAVETPTSAGQGPARLHGATRGHRPSPTGRSSASTAKTSSSHLLAGHRPGHPLGLLGRRFLAQYPFCTSAMDGQQTAQYVQEFIAKKIHRDPQRWGDVHLSWHEAPLAPSDNLIEAILGDQAGRGTFDLSGPVAASCVVGQPTSANDAGYSWDPRWAPSVARRPARPAPRLPLGGPRQRPLQQRCQGRHLPRRSQRGPQHDPHCHPRPDRRASWWQHQLSPALDPRAR